MTELKDFYFEASWTTLFQEEFSKPYFDSLLKFLAGEEAQNKVIFPAKKLIFNAFSLTPLLDVRVVIIGQDPYHNAGQAHGLSFSVPEFVKPPPSLQNIFKELHRDLGVPFSRHGNLSSWAQQGVLLLNTTLTVEESKPLSHHGIGWEKFTDAVVTHLAKRKETLIFVLWGRNAQDKGKLLAGSHHIILTAAHPSPLSARHGFFGCCHFSRINEYLASMGKPPILWELS